MRTLREKIPPVLTDPHLTILLRAIDGRHKKEVDELKRKIGLLRHHLQVSVGDTISVWAGDDLGIVQVPADEWYRASFGDE